MSDETKSKTLPFATPPIAPTSKPEDATLTQGNGPAPTDSAAQASSVTVAAAQEKPSAELGSDSRYEMLSELARGGMGRVMVAMDTRLGREIAIKETLHASDQRTVARFWRESLMTARLQHPGIVPVYEIGERSTGEPFLTMRRVQGRPLEAFISDAKTPDDRLRLLPNVLAAVDAVAYAHDRRVIHRDLKPANILIGQFGETVVIDWGLAKEFDDIKPGGEDPSVGATPIESSDEATGLTMRGAILGTPTHMPPEQAAGDPTDARADVYSLGAVLFHLLTGSPPFKGKNSREVLFKVLTEEVPELEKISPWVPLDLVSIVKRAMAKKVELRYPNARALADELRGFLSGQLVSSHRYTVGQRVARWTKKHAAALSIMAIALIVLVIAGVFSVKRIIAERQAANEARDIAEEKQQELALEKARLLKDTDPLAALEAIEALAPSFEGWGAARMLAEEIQNNGAPRWRVDVTEYQTLTAPLGDGLRLITDGPNRFWSLDPASGHLAKLSDNIHGTVTDTLQGSTLLLTKDSNVMRVYDAATGQEVGAPTKARITEGFGGGESRYIWGRLRPGPVILALVAKEGIVRIDPVHGTDELIVPLTEMTSFQVTRDGNRILFGAPAAGLTPAASRDDVSWLWDEKTGARQLPGSRTEDARISDDGLFVAWTAGGHGYVEQVDSTSAPRPIDENVKSISFSPKDDLVVIAGDAGLDIVDPRRPDQPSRHIASAGVTSAYFNKTGNRIVALSAGTAAVIDVATGNIEFTAKHQNMEGAIAEGDWLITYAPSELLGWGLASKKLTHLAGEGGPFTSFDTSASGRYWRTYRPTANNDGTLLLSIWQDDGRVGRNLDSDRLAFSPSGDLVAWRGADSLHVEGLSGVNSSGRSIKAGTGVARIADDGLVVLLSKERTELSVLTPGETKEQPVTLPAGVTIKQVANCGAGTFLLLGSDDHLRKLSTATLAVTDVVAWPGTGSVLCSPEGDRIFLTDEDRAPQYANMSDPARLVPLLPNQTDRGEVYAGRCGATAVWSESREFWLRADDEHPFHVIPFRRTFVDKAAFSPDGKQFCFLDGNGSVWLLDSGGGAPWLVDTKAVGCGFAAEGKALLVGHPQDVSSHPLGLSSDARELRNQLASSVHSEKLPSDTSTDGLIARKMDLIDKMIMRGRLRAASRISDEALAMNPPPQLAAVLLRNSGVIAARMGDRPKVVRQFKAYLPMARDDDREAIKHLIEKYSQPEEVTGGAQVTGDEK